jgi:hypothetical protein
MHATTGSRATFDFPQNSFVWEIKKIDSRPPNRATILSDFFTFAIFFSILATYPTHHIPYTPHA